MSFSNSDLHINVPLTDFAVAYKPELAGFLWSKLLPPKVVNKRSNFIRQLSKAQMLRKQELRVGNRGSVAEVSFKTDTSLSYLCADYAVQSIIDNTESMEADEILQYEQSQMEACLYAMNVNLDVITVKETLRNPAVMTQNLALTAPQFWDNFNSPASDPVNELKVACLRVKVETNNYPNVIVMHDYVWDRVQRHPKVLARGGVHPVGNAIVTVPQFEAILGVPPGTLQITSCQYNLALEDQAPDYRSMIGPDCIVAYVESPSTRSYGLGNTFMFQSMSGGAGDIIKEIEAPFVVYEFPDMGLKSTRGATIHRLVGGLDQKILVPEAGFLITSCVDASRFDLYKNMLNN